MDKEQIQEIRTLVTEEIMFASEAADYLGISTQRLNQLVHSGKLEPVKVSRAGTLFLKQDLDERKKEITPTKKEPKTNGLDVTSFYNCDPKVVYEAINFFTLQIILNSSEKKLQPILEELAKDVNMAEPIIDNITDVEKLLGIDKDTVIKAYDKVERGFSDLKPSDYIVKRGQEFYPRLLDETNEAPQFLFMRGHIQLVYHNTIAVVGTRTPSPEGEKRASVLSALLCRYRIAVASGLAKGIDTAAHQGALNSKNLTIAVIGTPLNKVYPKENAKLQQQIEEEGLVISQFSPGSDVHRWNFPMRNATMSGISLATVIIEAGETSGALIQANYALKQGRYVFIPQSALQNPNLKWPQKYIQQDGAESFSKIEELVKKLESSRVIEKASTFETITLFETEAGMHHVHRG